MTDDQIEKVDKILSIINEGIIGISDKDLIKRLQKENSYLKENYYAELPSIIDLLIEDGYITSSKKEMRDLSNVKLYDFNLLRTTIKGKAFCKNGYYKKYIRNQKIRDFPKNYWWFIAICAWLFGIAATIVSQPIGKWLDQYLNTNQPLQEFQETIDTSKNHKMSHDTVYICSDSLCKISKPSH